MLMTIMMISVRFFCSVLCILCVCFVCITVYVILNYTMCTDFIIMADQLDELYSFSRACHICTYTSIYKRIKFLFWQVARLMIDLFID